jgi:hypothetical protein
MNDLYSENVRSFGDRTSMRNMGETYIELSIGLFGVKRICKVEWKKIIIA